MPVLFGVAELIEYDGVFDIVVLSGRQRVCADCGRVERFGGNRQAGDGEEQAQNDQQNARNQAEFLVFARDDDRNEGHVEAPFFCIERKIPARLMKS